MVFKSFLFKVFLKKNLILSKKKHHFCFEKTLFLETDIIFWKQTHFCFSEKHKTFCLQKKNLLQPLSSLSSLCANDDCKSRMSELMNEGFAFVCMYNSDQASRVLKSETECNGWSNACAKLLICHFVLEAIFEHEVTVQYMHTSFIDMLMNGSFVCMIMSQPAIKACTLVEQFLPGKRSPTDIWLSAGT